MACLTLEIGPPYLTCQALHNLSGPPYQGLTSYWPAADTSDEKRVVGGGLTSPITLLPMKDSELVGSLWEGATRADVDQGTPT